MVELHGGEVRVESEPDRGSVFTCRFRDAALEPAAPQAPATAPRPSRAHDGGGRRVLVVEDNAMNRKLARNALRSSGFEVLEATTADEALELLTRERVDLVLMDLQLPGMDGLEATRRLKARPETAALPVVALTAHVREVDEQRALDAGCSGYITKPIRLAEFPGQVASYLVAERVPA